MTTWEEVFERGREVARILIKKGKPTAQYESGHGALVDGWKLSSLAGTADEPKHYGNTDYEEVYADYSLILGNDGVIYKFSLITVENGGRGTDGFKLTIEKQPSIHPIQSEIRYSAPSWEIQPDRVMDALNRLAKKENSNPEPAAPKASKEVSFSKNPVEPGLVQLPVVRSIDQPNDCWHAAPDKEKELPFWKFALIWTAVAFGFLGVMVIIAFVFLHAYVH